MSISFTCEQCGKSFTLDDRFAGKKGKCKSCGSIIRIPLGSDSIALDDPPEPRTRRAATAAPAADIYGFDDTPAASSIAELPPRLPDRDAPGRSPIRSRKPKPGGLFANSGKARSSEGSGAASVLRRVVMGVAGIVVAIVTSALGIPGIRSMVDSNWSTRSQIDTFIRRQMEMTNELSGVLRTVNDVPSAAAASPKANDLLRKLAQNLTSNKDRRGNQRDIDAIKNKYLSQSQQAAEGFVRECMRIAMIPGAVDALAIEVALKNLETIESSIPGANAQAKFNPPNFTPPAMPPPSFQPPTIPTAVSPPVPNRGRAALPVPPPGFVPDGNGGFRPASTPPPGGPPSGRPGRRRGANMPPGPPPGFPPPPGMPGGPNLPGPGPGGPG